MLPEQTRDQLAEKVRLYFQSDDDKLKHAALRMQDDGYGDTDIINILSAAYRAGYDDGFADGYAECGEGV